MPPKARIDAPGVLHHITARGIERRLIYKDDTDRENFLTCLIAILLDTRIAYYAWALMPNHFHLLLRTGSAPLSTLVQRLLTGYTISYNHRHRCRGHLFHRKGTLFQNRYKSILCQQEAYLLELVRYIHLNPLHAGMVTQFHVLWLLVKK